MRLKKVVLTNFRAYRDETAIKIDALTGLIGRNDVGKSSVFEALGAFLGAEGCSIEKADRNVHAAADTPMSVTCVFDDLPAELVLDDSAKTTLRDEWLLNADGDLEVSKVYRGDEKMKEEVIASCLHPTAALLAGLLEKKNAELKKIAADLKASADLRSNVELRAAIRNAVKELDVKPVAVPLAKEGARQIWDAIKSELPTFALFRADRASTDEDGEVQDPMKVAVREAIKTAEPQLAAIRKLVEEQTLEVAKRTLERLGEIDSRLASTLSPRFRGEPKWEGLFKLSLDGDDGIPINKRGSGVRRLVLLAFFQAEVERRRADRAASIIYAIEEPETSQHPTNQVAVIEALKELARSPRTQVMLSTHVPALAGLLPISGVRHVTQDDKTKRAIEGGEGILKAIADDLGVLPDLQDHRVRVFVCVEGPTDVEFLRNIGSVLKGAHPELPDLKADPRVAIVPLGGDSLKDWVNKRYLRELGRPEFHLYDGDKSDVKRYCDDVNARGDGSLAVQTMKREIENYLHPAAIEAVLGVAVAVDDACDVEEELAKVLRKRRVKGRSLKRILAEDATRVMTVAMLQERNGLDEVVGWLKTIGQYLAK